MHDDVPFPRTQRPAGRAREPVRARSLAVVLGLLAGVSLILAACAGGAPGPTGPLVPGTSSAPRDVVIQMYDYRYVPAEVDLVPGETVDLQVINGGLETHEAVFGAMPAQLAYESAEAATVGAPPGPTPYIAPPPDFSGTRIVAGSGQRVDVIWTVPPDAASVTWFLGCHIPGHWAKGMVAPVRFVNAEGQTIASPPSIPPMLPRPSG